MSTVLLLIYHQRLSQDVSLNDNGVSAAQELSYACLAVSLGIPTLASLMEMYKQIECSCTIKQINVSQAGYTLFSLPK